ncbi:MAG: hypothetical protein E7286_02630 [Lachnospiraceae bacterium]|nr:hypothetical protein [Lachnospiraceae bacterium]
MNNMKRIALIYGSKENKIQCKALEILGEFLLEYTEEYPMCFDVEQNFDAEKFTCIYIGTKENNHYIREHSTVNLNKPEAYNISVYNGTVMIEGADDNGVLYGCVDFYNRYLVKREFNQSLRYSVNNPFASPLTDFELTSAPAVSDRGIWTWGHVIYDFKQYIDNMVKLKMNTLIMWNDFAPLNAKQIVEYAHNCGIRVFFGFAWCWDTDCSRFSMDTILDNAEDVVRVYDTQYADVGADGVYFQSFTELNQDAIDGVLIADAVTCFVNYTSSKLFEKYPNLELQFGLHATSVKDKLEYIAATDPRIRIVWENCGTFPFRDYEYTPETYKQTQDFVREIADLRGENDKFGVVTKGFTGLDWHTFVHADSPVIIGQGSKKFIANRVTRKSKIWSMVQAFWISHAVQAQEMVQTLAEAKQGDLVLCALVEDGVFEENILYPVALYAQMLWNWDEDLLQMMNDVALRSYVDFA